MNYLTKHPVSRKLYFASPCALWERSQSVDQPPSGPVLNVAIES